MRRKVYGLVACALLCASGAPALAQGRRVDAGLLERIYRLVWPAGRFKGDLVRAVERTTQKSASSPENPRLYLVVVGQRSATEWKTGAGVAEPVICPADRTLVYRRGAGLVAEAIRTGVDGAVSAAGAPTPLESPQVSSLLACTAMATSTESVIWIQSTDGAVASFVRRGSKLEPTAISADLTAVPAQQLADHLRIMRSLRPDGLTVSVLNKSLVGESADRKRWLVVDSDNLTFFGVPAWVPQTDSVFVVAEQKERP